MESCNYNLNSACFSKSVKFIKSLFTSFLLFVIVDVVVAVARLLLLNEELLIFDNLVPKPVVECRRLPLFPPK